MAGPSEQQTGKKELTLRQSHIAGRCRAQGTLNLPMGSNTVSKLGGMKTSVLPESIAGF